MVFPSYNLQILSLIMVLFDSSIFVHSWCLQSNQNAKFEQKTSRFWEFEEETKTWVEINLPYDLKSCINGTCIKVGSIKNPKTNEEIKNHIEFEKEESFKDQELPIRRRVSLNRMSEASVWLTGQSGSIFERFWNGVQWVIAPHELPSFAGFAISTFIVNQTILSLSEEGILYQLQLNEDSQPVWNEVLFVSGEPNTNNEEILGQIQAIQIKSGVVSHDGKKLFLSSINGSLIEISEFLPFRWENHGRPPGGDVASITDTGNIKTGVLFTISSTGDLYEFDKDSKPSWKKHISTENISLKPSIGSVVHGLFGAQSISIFLLNKDGFLVERRLHRRKWKWSVHGAPEDQRLGSITPIYQNTEMDSSVSSLFFTTTSSGSVFEYQLPVRLSVGFHGNEKEGIWINRNHPKYAKIAQSIRGVQVQIGRTMFPLDDGRLAELHLPGLGGDESGPNPTHYPTSTRRKQISNKYEWSIVETPESEGWNGEYCTEEHGPMNCILGSKSDLISQASSRRRREEERQSNYISTLEKDTNCGGQDQDQAYNVITRSIELNYRMRVMHADRSLFLITDDGLTFEYLLSNGVWLWLRHERVTAMKGAVGSYNGSLYLVDINGNLFIRERTGDELTWINCTGLKKGRHVASGPPWDGRLRRVMSDDSLFFINKKGKLLQFTVALRAFKWKDCQNPPNTKIAFIIDQEVLRRNIIFVIGRNGRLYQYNRITELWHQHQQSPHLMLSLNPGTAMRRYHQLLGGSLFMVSVHGGLVEYKWTNQDGWEWVEHGAPKRDVGLVGTLGPCFDGTDLFVIGTDGLVYRRHLDQGTWRWTDHGYPNINNLEVRTKMESGEGSSCKAEDYYANSFAGECNEKVAAVRPIPFSEHSVIFELQDGRLGELRRQDESDEWKWIRIIGTPTSKCMTSYWTAVAT